MKPHPLLIFPQELLYLSNTFKESFWPNLSNTSHNIGIKFDPMIRNDKSVNVPSSLVFGQIEKCNLMFFIFLTFHISQCEQFVGFDCLKYIQRMRIYYSLGQHLRSFVSNFVTEVYLFIYFFIFFIYLFIYLVIQLFILYFNSVENHNRRHSKKICWPIYTE